jgi:hypothetical protein
MRKHFTVLASVATLAGTTLLASVTLLAADGQRRTLAQTAPNYDVAKEVTLTGTVDTVKIIPGPGQQSGVHLMLKTAKETIEIDLGPDWFLTQQKIQFAAGDAVTVIGSRVKIAANESVIARQIKRGEVTLTFRDEKGFPRWSGRGRF